MRHFIGLQEASPGSGQAPVKVSYEPASLITGHCLVVGMSGTGKTTETMRLMNSAAAAGMRVDAYDVHDELGSLARSTAITFSQHTRYGNNPLALSDDVHTGGPARQVEQLVRLIKQVSPWLGVRQESVLRNLCDDTYAAHGIFQDTPRTWRRRNVTENERMTLLSSKLFKESKQYYPTLEDLREFARQKTAGLALGGDNKAMTAYYELKGAVARLHRLAGGLDKAKHELEAQKLSAKLEDAKARYKEASCEWAEALETGRELEDILKYKSVDELQGVMLRLDLLNSNGIFRSNPPPFGDATVRVHQIKSMTAEQQVLYVRMEVQRSFDEVKLLGPIADGQSPRRMIYVDEAHRFFSKDPSDPLNVASKESRKFGLALVCASQQPTDFPRDFLTNCGAVLLTGIHGSYWKSSEGLLGINEGTLSRVRPREVVAVKLQRAKEANAPFVLVAVPNQGTISGRQARAIAASAA